MRKKKAIPTPKQRKAAALVIGNLQAPKPQPIGAILIQAGYSLPVSKKPTKVTESEGFIKCIEEAGATDDKLAQVLNEGLAAMSYIKTERVEGVGKGRLKTEEVVVMPDLNTRHRYLETALKLKGHNLNKPERPTGDTYNTFVQQNNIDPNTPESKMLVAKMLDVLMEQTKAV